MSFDTDEGMQKKWKAFLKKIDTETEDFRVVLDEIKAFLDEPFKAVLENREFTKHWSVNVQMWK